MEDKFIVKIPSVYSVIAGGAFTISAIFPESAVNSA